MSVMNISSLNSNGLGRGDFEVKWIGNLIKKHKVAFVGLQEFKRKEISDLLIKKDLGE